MNIEGKIAEVGCKAAHHDVHFGKISAHPGCNRLPDIGVAFAYKSAKVGRRRKHLIGDHQARAGRL